VEETNRLMREANNSLWDIIKVCVGYGAMRAFFKVGDAVSFGEAIGFALGGFLLIGVSAFAIAIVKELVNK